MKTYETPSSISSYAYCERLGALDKLYSFGGSKSVATVIGNLEHAAFQEYYKMFNLDCRNIKSGILDNEEKHQIRSDKVIEYVSEFFPNLYPSYYQHILDEIPSIRYRLDLHYKQKIEEIKNNEKMEEKKQIRFSDNIDELNQETDTLLEEIDKWQT